MMTSEFTALLAAVLLGVLIAVGLTGVSAVSTAENIFSPHGAQFSAKFVRP